MNENRVKMCSIKIDSSSKTDFFENWKCSVQPFRVTSFERIKWNFCMKIIKTAKKILIDLITFRRPKILVCLFLFLLSRNDWILFNSITILLPSNFLHAQKQEEEKTFTQMQNTIHKCVNRDTACVCTRTPDNRRFFLDTVNGGGGSLRICAKVCAKTAK